MALRTGSAAIRAKVAALLGAVLLSACAALFPGSAGGPGGPAAPAAQVVRLRVIGFNDFHGNLRSPGSYAAAPGLQPVPVGGADALAAHVFALKAGQPNSVVVAAGDLVGASPLVSALFHDEPTIEVMNRLGLDFSSVGNHEFDAGKEELLR